MSLPLEGTPFPQRREQRASDLFLVWNRRIHYFIGLYLLFFSWLFVFTGLLLNHPRWRFAEFWPNRVQNTIDMPVRSPAGTTDFERARDLMRQLSLDGEIQWPAGQPTAGTIAFQVSRPGLIVDVKVDPGTGRATLQRNELNAWGVIHLLHTFTGVPAGDTKNTRDWSLTTVWALSMDAVALGLIVMVFSSYVMWYRLKGKRRGGVVALLLGVAASALFISGLGWMWG